MPAETRSQRRRLREDETSTRATRTQGSGRLLLRPGSVFRSEQAEQAARYRANRRAVRIRPNVLARASRTLAVPRQRARHQGPVIPVAAEPLVDHGESSEVGEHWAPSLILGSSLSEDLSTIQVAERNVAQWRAILQYHEEHLPGAVSPIQEMLAQAIAERHQLDESEDNRKPRSALPSTAQNAINDRVSLLRSTLDESKFGPEAANIRAAIAGYATGAIPYSSNFTLIYAGRVVDTCPSYASFSSPSGRPVRLDRYAAAYGPGWLWYEPPLMGDPSGGAGGGGCETLKSACVLANPRSRRDGVGDGGYWEVTMGFRRRIAWVSREVKDDDDDGKDQGEDGERCAHSSIDLERASHTLPDPTAPTVFFSMHLDSGASKATLYADDFKAIGIDPSRYAAQTAVWAQGVWDRMRLKMFEVDVGIYGSSSSSSSSPGIGAQPRSLVSTSPPERVWPAEPDRLGATLPVLMINGKPPAHSRGPADCNRLSGMLPFYAAYVSAVPGTHAIWLGEDRRDVLGSARMPGQVRYCGFAEPRGRGRGPGSGAAGTTAATMTTPRPSSPKQLRAGNPAWMAGDLGAPDRIVFEHAVSGEPETWLRDEDLGTGASVITLNSKFVGTTGAVGDGDGGADGPSSLGDVWPRSSGGGGGGTKTWRVEPRRQVRQARALKAAASATKRAVSADDEPRTEEKAGGRSSCDARVKRRKLSKA